ncbi:hypothetical protein [Streptomyces sp. NPDC000410]|uniref:hypothetical protein n=1 Tax=Streptomyces sp. NPDC000410 TaxID=3154254 RepID=UPI00331C5BB8
MTRGMEEWADGSVGRIVSHPDPDAYVLVDGVLLRMLPHPPGALPGTEVEVRHDAGLGRLVAYARGAARG